MQDKIKGKSKIIYLSFCLILFVLIVYRYQVFESGFNDSELRQHNDSGEVVLIGRIIKEPDVRETNIKLTLETDLGKILATVSRYPEYQYRDELEIKGELQTPAVFEDFNYKNYLKKDRIYSVVYYPEVKLLNRGEYDNLISAGYAEILFFKDRIRQSIYKALSPPQSSVLGAMLLGDKNRMSSELKDKLNRAGVRHITAVSGMHVLILSTIIMSLLLALGFWRNQAFYLSLVIIFLFITLTGFQSSGVRAGIMAGLLLLARKTGRRSLSFRAIIITAGIMLVINPLLLFYDIGFQLSFLAVMGIMFLSEFFKKKPSFISKYLRDIIAMTLSAYIFTLPILLYNFGRISLVALLTNVLIIPVVYGIMIFGFLFSLAGIFSSFLGLILSFPCWLLLTYVLKIIDIFSQPWASIFINIHWIWLIFLYLFLAVLIYYLKKKESQKLSFLR